MPRMAEGEGTRTVRWELVCTMARGTGYALLGEIILNLLRK